MTSSYVFKHYQIITSTVMFTIVFGIGCKAKKKRVLISGNTGEEKDPTLYCPKRKKPKFVRIKFLVENRLNGEFCCPNFFHYIFQVQSLT